MNFSNIRCDEKVSLIRTDESEQPMGYLAPMLGVDLTKVTFCSKKNCYQLDQIESETKSAIKLQDNSFCHSYSKVDNEHLFCEIRNLKAPTCMYALPSQKCKFRNVNYEEIQNMSLNLHSAKLYPKMNKIFQNLYDVVGEGELQVNEYESFRGQIKKLKYFLSEDDIVKNFGEVWSFRNYLMDKLYQNDMLIGASFVSVVLSIVPCFVIIYRCCVKYRYSRVPTTPSAPPPPPSPPPELDRNEIEMNRMPSEHTKRIRKK